MSDNLFFITGRGRSGSWLLKSILDSHPEISVAPEALFLINLKSKYGKVIEWTDRVKLSFYNDLIKERKIIDWWNVDLVQLKSKVFEASRESVYQNMILIPYELYRQHQKKEEKALLADKNPEYSLHIDYLSSLFPASKFIALVRDPRDNISSYKKVKFDSNDNYSLAYRWYYYNNAILDAKAKLKEKLLIIRFEDLLLKSVETLQEICNFLELHYHDDLLKFYESPKNVLDWNSKITKPLDQSLAFRWKKENNNIGIELSICKDIMDKFGYDTEGIKDLKPSLKYRYLKGSFVTRLEIFFFKLPYGLRQFVLEKYRVKTKILK